MYSINKILVIGAGIAGPAVCYWLRKFGFSPVLIEKYPSIRKGGHALDVRGVAIDLAKHMGIYEKICDRRTKVQLGQYVDAKGNTLHEENGERFCFRQGEEVEIIRGDLVEILIQAMEGVPCYFNQLVNCIHQSADCVEVHFKDGRIENYDLVIGADGSHSATRGMVFNKDDYELVDLGACFSVFSIPNYLKLNHTEIQYESNQKLISLTSDSKPEVVEAAFMFRAPNHTTYIRNEKEQQQYLRDHFRDFGWETAKILELMPDSPDFYFDSVTQVKMKSWTKGRVALLGDAGYCPSPLSGQGNNLALVGAYILAGELKQSNGNHDIAFNRYNERLRPFVDANQKLGVLANQLFLSHENVDKEIAETRSNELMEQVRIASNMMALPEYL